MTAKTLLNTEIDSILHYIEQHGSYRDPAQAMDLAAKLQLWKLLCDYGKYYEHDHMEHSGNPRRHNPQDGAWPSAAKQ